MLVSEQAGTGLPLVFLHAFPFSQKMWEINKSAFSKNFRFISIDLPGMGGSPLSGETSTMEDMARQVLSTLDQMQVREKFVVTGVSMGGYVLLQLAKLALERLRGISLISTRSIADTPEVRLGRVRSIEMIQKKGGVRILADQMIPKLFGQTSLSSRNLIIEEARHWIESNRPEGLCAALRGMAERPDSTPLLTQIQVPALVLSGAEDVVVKSGEMEAMANHIKSVEYHVLPRSGHVLTMERPDLYADLFLRFLKRRIL